MRRLSEIIDLVRLARFHNREISSKSYYWYAEVQSGRSERYRPLVETFGLRAAMFHNADDAPDILTKISTSSWYLSPRTELDKFCIDYIDFLKILKNGENREQIIDHLKSREVSPFARRMLNPPQSM